MRKRPDTQSKKGPMRLKEWIANDDEEILYAKDLVMLLQKGIKIPIIISRKRKRSILLSFSMTDLAHYVNSFSLFLFCKQASILWSEMKMTSARDILLKAASSGGISQTQRM